MRVGACQRRPLLFFMIVALLPTTVSLFNESTALAQSVAGPIDGRYVGSFVGTSTDDGETEVVSGNVTFTIDGRNLIVTAPGSGTGTVSGSGGVIFSTSGGGTGPEGDVCLFSGTFVVAGDLVSGTGSWSCTFDGGGSEGVWQADRRDRCPVPPLTPVTDPAALDFEAGNTLDTDNLIPEMQEGLSCLRGAAQAAGGSFTVRSAYRPPAYQAHLREVWDRWSDLRNRRDDACEDLRNEVEGEFERHELRLTQRPADNSAHSRAPAEAFDANWNLPAGRSIDMLAESCNLQRPFVDKDPVHFIFRPRILP